MVLPHCEYELARELILDQWHDDLIRLVFIRLDAEFSHLAVLRVPQLHVRQGTTLQP